MRYSMLACLSLIAVTSAIAQSPTMWMSDDEIRRAFAGTSIDGAYIDGLSFTEAYADDGSIAYRDKRKAMTGKWSIVNNSFCTLYHGIVTGGCFKVLQRSANCFEFYFLASTEIEAAMPKPRRPSWTARGWNKAKPATCEEKPVA
jgi:hypothetical protein